VSGSDEGEKREQIFERLSAFAGTPEIGPSTFIYEYAPKAK
jgi:hypothetical protein